MRLPAASYPAPVPAITCALALATGPLLASGLENGEIQANAQFLSGGSAVGAEQELAMEVRSPGTDQFPPLPNSAPALARIDATMAAITHLTTAGSTSDLNQFNSAAQSLVEYVDNLVVDAEGIAVGTDLIVTVAWEVSGQTEFNAPDRIRTRSRLLLDAVGIDLDPDPNAPDPPRQQWARDFSNYDENVPGEFGQVSFDFLVQAGTPSPGNIRLRSATGSLVGGPGSTFTGTYNCLARSELTATLVGAIDVKTKTGQTLYRWATNAHSGLDYGFRDDEPPTAPPLTTGNSPAGSEFTALSWNSRKNHHYFVEVTKDGTNWTFLTEVAGTGQLVDINVIRDSRVTEYRLQEFFGGGSTGHTVRPPTLHVFRKEDNGLNVRLAWNTHPREIYQLNEVLPDGLFSPVFAAIGDGSAVWFDFPPTESGRVFRISAIQN
ncbi:MAG: hypothetical protein MK194_07805 [Roseibacillus sp.]|nr:hypothetical protein [Roseibacillus sp.]